MTRSRIPVAARFALTTGYRLSRLRRYGGVISPSPAHRDVPPLGLTCAAQAARVPLTANEFESGGAVAALHIPFPAR